MIIQMRSDVNVQVVCSNVVVTSLMMVVHGGGVDASINPWYVTATTTVVIGRMKSFVQTQNFIVEMMSVLEGRK